VNAKLTAHLSAAISAAAQCKFELRSATPVGGGSINESLRIESTDGNAFFLKLNDAKHYGMFIAEAAGLDAINKTGTLRVPHPVIHGVAEGRSYLVLEHLQLTSRGNGALLGSRLAALHRCTVARFGFGQDNFIGTTAQANRWTDDWITFWREQRLGFQLRLAAEIGYGGELQKRGEELLDALPVFFAGHSPQPSLLHGDLWGGNHAYLADGTPVIFDPAVYYGDRECDIAMTELFGGYGADFHAAYRAAWPLDAGYPARRELYNLYHILNHANLFGGSYLKQAEQMMQRLLSGLK
jgi:fructosamine-3-kinase